MKDTIQNGKLSFSINRLGAELYSLRTLKGVEYIWQADTEIWARHAPILFPVIGKLKDNKYRYGNKWYHMNQHGFARDENFEFKEKTQDSLKYCLQANDRTLKSYPFEFGLSVIYKLTDNILNTDFEVKNNSDKIMPFSLGGHPGFSCFWGRKDKLEDFYLEFEHQENSCRCFLEHGLLTQRKEKILSNDRVLPLTGNLFDKDALIFMDLKSKQITLCSKLHSTKLRFRFPDFPCLGIWSKPGAPYVCLEPWFGHADPVSSNYDLLTKPGIVKLEPGQVFNCGYSIEIIS